MSKKKLKGFKPYLFDFLVIVLGVTVSFWFNQLAIKRNDNKERIKVLTSIEKEAVSYTHLTLPTKRIV